MDPRIPAAQPWQRTEPPGQGTGPWWAGSAPGPKDPPIRAQRVERDLFSFYIQQKRNKSPFQLWALHLKHHHVTICFQRLTICSTASQWKTFLAAFIMQTVCASRNISWPGFCGKLQAALTPCSGNCPNTLPRVKGLKNKVPVLRQRFGGKKEREREKRSRGEAGRNMEVETREGQQGGGREGRVRSRLLFFECISQPMEHVGKRCQIKKVPFPFLAWLAVKLCTQRAFFWRTTLTKTAEHNISPPSNKRNRAEKEGRKDRLSFFLEEEEEAARGKKVGGAKRTHIKTPK